MCPDKKRHTESTPPPTEYDEKYFLSNCGGYKEFLQGQISYKHTQALQYLDVQAEESVLDIGCGRGEVTKEAGKMGAKVVGLDYSLTAIRMAAGRGGDIATLIQADATMLPFRSQVFDKVAMLDVSEHLSKEDFLKCLVEVNRVLREHGSLLIHTPNLYGEKLDRIDRKLLKRKKNTSPASYSKLHVNVLTARSLRGLLTQAGFAAKIWFASDSLLENAPLYRVIANRLLWFTTSIWCRACKTKQ